MPDEDAKGTLAPSEVQGWLRQEVKDAAKAFELRVREATELTVAYASGQISAEESARLLQQYDRRWGEALFGTTSSQGVSDEFILESIDKARNQSITSRIRLAGSDILVR